MMLSAKRKAEPVRDDGNAPGRSEGVMHVEYQVYQPLRCAIARQLSAIAPVAEIAHCRRAADIISASSEIAYALSAFQSAEH